MFRALGVRNYRLYFTGQVLSNAGTWMQRVAQDWLVLDLSGSSAVALGITTGNPGIGFYVDANTPNSDFGFDERTARKLALRVSCGKTDGLDDRDVHTLISSLCGRQDGLHEPIDGLRC